MRSVHLVYLVLALVVFANCILEGECQEEDEDDEYDEETGDPSTTTRRPKLTTTATAGSLAGNSTSSNGNSTAAPLAAIPTAVATPAGTQVVAPAPAVAPAPRPPPPVTIQTTTESEYEDDEVTEEVTSRYGYIFNPLNKLVDNIVAGNVTGIVDNALSIRTPPEIRTFVNNVMSNVFGSGIGSAVKQFMPHLFSTKAPPTPSLAGRDPIPDDTIQIRRRRTPQPEIIEARSNDTEEITHKPMEIAIKAHPGAPTSRLRCQLIH